MKKILLIAFTISLFLISCKEQQNKPVVKAIKTQGLSALGPYLTYDNKGNPVLCWTEQDRKDSLYRLKYAVYDLQQDQFGAAVTVPASAGCSISPESMGKIAFKSDGTVMAVFGKQFEKEKNPYAGAIYYSFSADKGKTWTQEKFLHSDTSHTYGRSFFDITILKNGELASVWLDGRYGKSIKGSALFFSRTVKGKGFLVDTCLDKGTCECCRTDILSDGSGNIHIAYRNITFPSALEDKQVRDMAYKISTDNGKTFSATKTISKDNWQIEGCPHSGPSLAITNSTVNAVWFTAGGSQGLYYTSARTLSNKFNQRNLITATGRHPQIVTFQNGKIAMVYENPIDKKPEKSMEMEQMHHNIKMAHEPASLAKIILKVLKNGNAENSADITNGQFADHHAVIKAIGNGLLIAWVRETENGSKIYYSKVTF